MIVAYAVIAYFVVGFFVALAWMALNRDWILEQKSRQGKTFAGIGQAMRAFFLWPAVIRGGMRHR